MALSRAVLALAALSVAAAPFGAGTRELASSAPGGRVVAGPVEGSGPEPTTPAPSVSPSVSPSARASAPTDLPGWRLDLAEDFDRLDPAVWNVRDHTSNSNEDSYLLAANVTVSGGVLRIQGRQQAAGGRQYTSGYIDTNGRYAAPRYFRAEVRAKVPFEQGLWAAPLWLRPADYSGGEIDVVETYGSERGLPTIHQTLHTDYGPGHLMAPRSATFAEVGDPAGTGWHTYTVEKVPGRITMWVDGRQTATWSQGSPGWFDRYYEAGKQWNLRVNLQIGGAFGGLPDSTTDWAPDASALLVDHIYVWAME